MHSEYVPIDNQRLVKKWRCSDIFGFVTLLALSVYGVHLLLTGSTTAARYVEQPVGLSEVTAPVLPDKPRLYAEGFKCKPNQAAFVYHTITNIARLANVNRDVPDKDGLQETFIFYEAFATKTPVSSCDQLWLLEAFPNQSSEKLHQKAAYKNGLEILQTLRSDAPEDGLAGFDFARGENMVHSFNCATDCQAELKELKKWLKQQRKIKKAAQKAEKADSKDSESDEEEKVKPKPKPKKKKEEKKETEAHNIPVAPEDLNQKEKEKLKQEIIEELRQAGEPYTGPSNIPKEPSSSGPGTAEMTEQEANPDGTDGGMEGMAGPVLSHVVIVPPGGMQQEEPAPQPKQQVMVVTEHRQMVSPMFGSTAEQSTADKAPQQTTADKASQQASQQNDAPKTPNF